MMKLKKEKKYLSRKKAFKVLKAQGKIHLLQNIHRLFAEYASTTNAFQQF